MTRPIFQPPIEQLRGMRGIGVKSAKFADNDLVEVEFFESTPDERLGTYVEALTAEEKAAMQLLSKDERAKAIRERQERILFHSS